MRRRARILQIVCDLAKKPVSDLRLLDLGCLEGHYSFEFAAKGARVVGIEGRKCNLDNAEALGAKLKLSVEFVQDDVRNLSAVKYGTFDIVLCLGILYHLDDIDIIPFLRNVYDVTRDFAVVDTLIALKAYRSLGDYWGWDYIEYSQPPSKEEQEKAVWASIGNTKSFWLTKPSLVNALATVGFSSVMEVHFPTMNDMPSDRVTVVALKGQRTQPIIEHVGADLLGELLPEVPTVPPVQPVP